jgi:phospholipid/cholesterol/gamma-HCH transport system substrate-binding protein
MSQRMTLMVAAGCAALALVGILLLIRPAGYEVRFVVPSAAQLVVGSPARIQGTDVGQVSDLDERDGQAIVTVSLSGDRVPLHEGTTARVDWQSVLGERLIAITPGPEANAEIPSGAMYRAESTEVEADQVLAALDKPTRDRLVSLVDQLHRTTEGREQELRQTLRSAGPSVQAIGVVLQGLGRDGPAIKSLVTDLDKMAGGLASRQDRLSGSVHNLTTLAGTVASRKDQLADGLREVPATLDTARATLDKIPAATGAAVPLLDDLRPGVQRLPSVADNLRPVLHDLRPIANDLRPVVGGLGDLFAATPDLADSAHKALPPLAQTMDKLGPATEFLRPYSPEFAGWLGGFGSGFSSYDSQGKAWTITPNFGAGAMSNLPGSVPPYHQAVRPAPGSSVGQPWVDANGDGER